MERGIVGVLDQILASVLPGVSGQHLLAVLLAATGAVLLGLAAVRQHGAVQHAVALEGRGPRQGLRSFGRMVRQPAWLLGILQGFVGGSLHIVALTIAPIVLVQPIGVIAVPVTGVASAIKHRRRPSLRQITGTLVSLASVSTMTAVLLVPSGTESGVVPSVPTVIVTVAAAIGVALAVGRSQRATRPLLRCTALAATAAGLFGITSVLVRTVGTILDRGMPAADQPLLFVTLSGMALTLPVGFWAMQTAYASGSPQVVVCCMTLIDPVTAAVGGRLLLQEGVALTAASAWAAIGCGILAAVGVVLLSGTETATGSAGRGRTSQKAAEPEPLTTTDREAPLRILLGADQYPEYINGAANFTIRLAERLAARGHTVDLIWPAADGRHRSYLERGVRIHRLTSVALPSKPRMRVCAPWAAQREIELIMQITRPDVVHVQSHLTLGRSLIRVAKARGVPVVATNHFMPENLVHHVPVLRHFPQLAARVAWRDVERVFADAAQVTAPTSRAVQLLASATNLPPATAISCGIDLGKYRGRAFEATAHPPTVLFVGRLEREKHVDELLRAFARLPSRDGARLEIVGIGSLRGGLEALACDLGIARSVTFLGAISEDDLVPAVSRADVFVMPGTAELQSLATLEAMSAGRPVVAANAMALPHLVQNDVNGYLYPPGEVDSLSDVLARLLADPELRQRLGAASALRAEAHDLSATVSTFEACYHTVARRQPVTDQADSAEPAAILVS